MNQRARDDRLAGLPQPLRAALRLATFLMARGLASSPMADAAKPHAERLLIGPIPFACKPGDKSVRTWDTSIPGRGGPVPVRCYVPQDLQPNSPVIFYIHGGGFILGGLEICDYITRRLAARTGYLVVSAAYRLAPDHPFPAGLEDCQDVLDWIVTTRPDGIDPERVAVAGESAGGNLAAALTIWARDNGGPRIAHQTIAYPFTDATLASSDWDTKAMPGVGRTEGEHMVSSYAPGESAKDPLVSVLHADLRGMPSVLVITCECDVLRLDGLRFADALRAAGAPLVHRHYDDMPHGFLTMSRLTRRADECLDLIATDITRTLTIAGVPAIDGAV